MNCYERIIRGIDSGEEIASMNSNINQEIEITSKRLKIANCEIALLKKQEDILSASFEPVQCKIRSFQINNPMHKITPMDIMELRGVTRPSDCMIIAYGGIALLLGERDSNGHNFLNIRKDPTPILMHTLTSFDVTKVSENTLEKLTPIIKKCIEKEEDFNRYSGGLPDFSRWIQRVYDTALFYNENNTLGKSLNQVKYDILQLENEIVGLKESLVKLKFALGKLDEIIEKNL